MPRWCFYSNHFDRMQRVSAYICLSFCVPPFSSLLITDVAKKFCGWEIRARVAKTKNEIQVVVNEVFNNKSRGIRFRKQQTLILSDSNKTKQNNTFQYEAMCRQYIYFILFSFKRKIWEQRKQKTKINKDEDSEMQNINITFIRL